MLSSVTIALLGAVPILIYLFLTWNRNYWQKRGVTTAPVKLLMGSFPEMFSRKQHFSGQLNDIYKRYSANEKFVGVFQMRQPQLLILDPALMREILDTHFENFHDNDVKDMFDMKKEPLLAKNPFMLQGEDWKIQHDLIAPGMTSNRIKVAYSLTQTVCWKLCHYIEEASQICGRDGINGKELALRFTSQSVADCVLGIKINSFGALTPPMTQQFNFLLQDHSKFIIHQAIANVFPILKKFYKAKFMSKECDKFFLDLMKEAFDNRAINPPDYQDFMHLLMTLKDELNISHTEMAAHTMTFLFDGLETTALVISHALYLLARYPETQDKLRREVLCNLDDENGELSYDVLNALPYLDACFHESLRIFPPGAWTAKICTKAHEFTNTNGQKVPIHVGEVVILPIFSIHRDAKYYPEPEEFKPERFLPENGGLQRYLDMGVFLGFGAGPRACLGKQFALVQSKAAIASIVKRFIIRLKARTTVDVNLDPNIFTIMKDGGVWLDFERVY